MLPYLDLAGIKINVFPIILVVAIFNCILVFVYSAKYDTYYFPQIKWSSLYCMMGAGIGGKLLYIITRGTSSNLNLFERLGGFVFYGGLIGAIIGLLIYSKLKWNRFFDLLDAYVSILPLGQAIGRIGCYLNGCCYGKQYTGFGAVSYIVDGREIQVFPTWFVESIFCFVLFISMFRISKKIYSGMYSAMYMLVYSLFRFVIEIFRGDSLRGVWFGFSTSQYVSIGVACTGIAILIKSVKEKEDNLLIKGRN